MPEAPSPATHWLLLPEPVGREEMESLIVSRALGAAWVDERTVGWQPGVLLQGPLTEEELHGGGDLPEWVGAVYAVTCPRERGPAIPPELRIPGGVLAPFVDGEPEGVERETLETIEAIARRLGGGVLTDTGVIVVPEPRVDLILFASTWIEAEDMVRFLSGVGSFEDAGGPVAPPDMDIPGYTLTSAGAADEAAEEESPAGVAAEGGIVEGGLAAGAVAAVTASEAEVIPLAFAGYGWASETVYVYEFRYYRPHAFDFSEQVPSTPQEAAAAAPAGAVAWIETIASTALRAVGEGGHLCDDDGFLVVL